MRSFSMQIKDDNQIILLNIYKEETVKYND